MASNCSLAYYDCGLPGIVGALSRVTRICVSRLFRPLVQPLVYSVRAEDLQSDLREQANGLLARGETVSSVEIEPFDDSTGVMSTMYWVTATVRTGEAAAERKLRLLAKCRQNGNFLFQCFFDTTRTELRFYAKLAAIVRERGVLVPRYVGSRSRFLTFEDIIIMEAAPSSFKAIQLDEGGGLEHRLMLQHIRQLARLHSLALHRGSDPTPELLVRGQCKRGDDVNFLSLGFFTKVVGSVTSDDFAARLIERSRDNPSFSQPFVLSPGFRRGAELVAAVMKDADLRQFMFQFGFQPGQYVALLHGDPHAGNTLVNEETGEVMVVDWQGPRVGPFVAEFLYACATTGRIGSPFDAYCDAYFEELTTNEYASDTARQYTRAEFERDLLIQLPYFSIVIPCMIFSLFEGCKLGPMQERCGSVLERLSTFYGGREEQMEKGDTLFREMYARSRV